MSFRIPFNWTPTSWALRGKTRERAQAEYELTGEELERKLIEIDHEKDSIDYTKKNLALDLKVNKITKQDYELALLKIEFSGESKDYKLRKVELDLKYNVITKNQYEKEIATIENKPWAGIIDSSFDGSEGLSGLTMKFDYNPQMIEFLKEHGFEGFSDEQIFQEYVNELCKSVATEDDFAQYSILPQAPYEKLHIQTKPKGSGTTEYS